MGGRSPYHARCADHSPSTSASPTRPVTSQGGRGECRGCRGIDVAALRLEVEGTEERKEG